MWNYGLLPSKTRISDQVPSIGLVSVDGETEVVNNPETLLEELLARVTGQLCNGCR